MEHHLDSATRLHLDLACLKLRKTDDDLDITRKHLDLTQKFLGITQEKWDATEERFKETTCKLEERINALESTLMYRSEVIINTWKVTDISTFLHQAKSGEKDSIESRPFYNCGYKFVLLLYLNRCGLLKNTHLQLFFKIMRGEYDAILPWPFHKKVTFTLIDQQEKLKDRKNIVESFTTYPDLDNYFARPETDGNEMYKYGSLALSHTTLRERCYLVNDTVFIQVQFNSPKWF